MSRRVNLCSERNKFVSRRIPTDMVINNKIPRTFVFQTDKLTKLKNIIIKLDVTSSEFVQRAEQICIETHSNGHGYQ